MATIRDQATPQLTGQERTERLEKALVELAVYTRGALDKRFWRQNPSIRTLVEEISDERIELQ